VADEVLRHIVVSNAYQARERQDSIRLTLMSCPKFLFLMPRTLTTYLAACAIHADRHDIVVEQCRKLINQHQFNNEPLRILTASLASGLRNTDAFITSTLQKHLFREMKLSDMAVKNPGNLRWNPLNKRYALKGGTGKDVEEEEDEEEVINTEASESKTTATPRLPTKEDPMIVTIYGQICIAAKSYQSAICEALSITLELLR